MKHLDFEMKRALASAVRKTLPEAEPDKNQLYREFAKALSLECSVWHNVPDHCVDQD